MIRFVLSFFAACAIIVLPGITTVLLMVSRCTTEWWKRWRPAVWFIILPAGYLVISLIMEALVLPGLLSFKRVVAASLLYTFVTAWIALSRSNSEQLKSLCKISGYRWFLVPVTLLLLYTSITVYPFEFIFDTTDCGVYVSSGISAFRNGSFRFIEPDLITDDEPFLKAFYHVTPPERFSSARRFRFEGMIGAGLFIRSFETGLVEPRYFNCHPLWTGLFVSLFGLNPGVWLATPFAAICGMCGIFLLAWTLAGRVSAVLTTGFLSVFVLQVWFGRYITTEMAFQAAVMNGLAWYMVFGGRESGKNRLPLVYAGAMTGLTHFTRIDSILIIPALGASMLLAIVFSRRRSWITGFVLSYVIVASAAVYAAAFQAQSYTLETFRHLDIDDVSWNLLLIPAVSAGFALISAMILRTYAIAIRKLIENNVSALKWTVIVLVVLTIFYGYFIRPVIYPPDYNAFYTASQTERSYALSQMTLRWLGWYMTIPGLFAAFAGLTLLVINKFTVRTAPVLIVFAVYLICFSYALRCTPYHYWGMRRFTTVAIPALFIGMSYLICETLLWCRKRQNVPVAAFTAVFLAYVTLFYIYDLRLITGFNHWRGAFATLEKIDAAIPEDGRLILESYPGMYIYVPLKYIYRKNVYLQQREANKSVVSNTVKMWLDSGDRVFFLTYQLPKKPVLYDHNYTLIMSDKSVYPLVGNHIRNKPIKRSAHSFTWFVWELD